MLSDFPRLGLIADDEEAVRAYVKAILEGENFHTIEASKTPDGIVPLDMNQPPGSPGFFAGNSMFLTRKLWGIANQHPFGHHGLFTTMREAVLSHHGEAEDTRSAFQQMSKYDRDALIEFLKSLQIVSRPDTKERKDD